MYFTICAINVWNHLYHFVQFICRALQDREYMRFATEMSLALKRDFITIKFVEKNGWFYSEMPSTSDICELHACHLTMLTYIFLSLCCISTCSSILILLIDSKSVFQSKTWLNRLLYSVSISLSLSIHYISFNIQAENSKKWANAN